LRKEKPSELNNKLNDKLTELNFNSADTNTTATAVMPVVQEIASRKKREGFARKVIEVEKPLKKYIRRTLLSPEGNWPSEEDVDEVFQATIEKAWKNRNQFDGKNFLGWLYKTSLNYIIDGHRRSKKDPLAKTTNWDSPNLEELTLEKSPKGKADLSKYEPRLKKKIEVESPWESEQERTGRQINRSKVKLLNSLLNSSYNTLNDLEETILKLQINHGLKPWEILVRLDGQYSDLTIENIWKISQRTKEKMAEIRKTYEKTARYTITDRGLWK